MKDQKEMSLINNDYYNNKIKNEEDYNMLNIPSYIVDINLYNEFINNHTNFYQNGDLKIIINNKKFDNEFCNKKKNKRYSYSKRECCNDNIKTNKKYNNKDHKTPIEILWKNKNISSYIILDLIDDEQFLEYIKEMNESQLNDLMDLFNPLKCFTHWFPQWIMRKASKWILKCDEGREFINQMETEYGINMIEFINVLSSKELRENIKSKIKMMKNLIKSKNYNYQENKSAYYVFTNNENQIGNVMINVEPNELTSRPIVVGPADDSSLDEVKA